MSEDFDDIIKYDWYKNKHTLRYKNNYYLFEDFKIFIVKITPAIAKVLHNMYL